MSRFFKLLRVETARLFSSRLCLLAALVCAASPAAGLGLYETIGSMSMNVRYIGNPAMAGALVSAVVFAFISVWECDRVRRAGTEALIDASVSPLQFALCQTLSLFLLALFTQLLTLAFWLPFAAFSLGTVFDLWLCVSVYLLVMFFAMLFAILFASSAYRVSYRLDLSLILFAAFLLWNMLLWQENWLLRWVSPSLDYLSDDFGNVRRLRSLAWNRMFFTFALGAFFCFSLLCVRRYGRSLFASLRVNARKPLLLLLCAVLIAAGCFSYLREPFMDDCPEEIDYEAYYNVEYIDVALKSIHVNARPDLSSGCQWGSAEYLLENPTLSAQTLGFKINPGYSVSRAEANGKGVEWRVLKDDAINTRTLEVDIPAEQDIKLVIDYGGFPREWSILATMQGELEISRDYIYLDNSAFSPTPNNFYTADGERPPFTASIALPENLVPVLFGDGTAKKLSSDENGNVSWALSGSGGSMILYAGDYICRPVQTNDMEVDFYYSAKHDALMKACDVENTLARVFDYCSEHIGVLSFGGEQRLKLIEIGAVGGGYAGGGASVMSEDSFSAESLRDPVKGASGSEVLAHEIIHQWWGLGNMFDSPDMSGAWSSEGLTVYTTYRMMKHFYGEDYAQRFYVDEWQKSVDDYHRNFYVRHPEYLELLPEKYRADIHNELSQVRQYCEMPLMILKAEKLVGGEEKMDEILYSLFNREIDYEYPYLTYQDFLDGCGLSEEDLKLV